MLDVTYKIWIDCDSPLHRWNIFFGDSGLECRTWHPDTKRYSEDDGFRNFKHNMVMFQKTLKEMPTRTMTFLPKMCSARIILNRLTPSFAKKGLVLEVQLVDTVSRMHSHWILWKVSDHPLTLRPSESPFIHLYHFFKFESESEQTEIRNWCQLMPNAAKLSNCYRSRKTDEQMNMRVPQSFSFFPQEGVGASMLWYIPLLDCDVFFPLPHLPLFKPPIAPPAMPHNGAGIETEERVPRRLRGQGDRRDIFALVKGNMSDTTLIQPPLLVWPESLIGSVEDFWNRVNTTQEIVQQSLDQTRVDELLELAAQIDADFPNMGRATQYYRTLVDPNRPRNTYEQLKFVAAGPHAASRVGEVRLGNRPPPPRAHRLQVTFHHRQG